MKSRILLFLIALMTAFMATGCAEMFKNWGFSEEESKTPRRSIHTNCMQPWKVARDGSITDAMFS